MLSAQILTGRPVLRQVAKRMGDHNSQVGGGGGALASSPQKAKNAVERKFIKLGRNEALKWNNLLE